MHVSCASSAMQYSAMQNNAPGASCAVGRCHEGEDGGHDKHGGRLRGAGGFANLISSVFNALAQTAAAPAGEPAADAATSAAPVAASAPAAPATAAAADGANPTQDLLQKVATFMQNLFAAMGQARGHDHHHGHHHGHGHRRDADALAASAEVSPTSTAPAAVDATGGSDAVPAVAAPVVSASETSPVRFYRHHEHGGGLAGKLQSLLRQIGDGVPQDASGPLADLNTAFQSLISALHPAGGDGAAAQPTLQDFLHKLVQNLGGSGADTGTVSGSLINATA